MRDLILDMWTAPYCLKEPYYFGRGQRSYEVVGGRTLVCIKLHDCTIPSNDEKHVIVISQHGSFDEFHTWHVVPHIEFKILLFFSLRSMSFEINRGQTLKTGYVKNKNFEELFFVRGCPIKQHVTIFGGGQRSLQVTREKISTQYIGGP